MRCEKCRLIHDPADTARCANAQRLAVVLANAGAIWGAKKPETIEEAVQEACERRSA